MAPGTGICPPHTHTQARAHTHTQYFVAVIATSLPVGYKWAIQCGIFAQSKNCGATEPTIARQRLCNM
jgi:hypothetical protein